MQPQYRGYTPQAAARGGQHVPNTGRRGGIGPMMTSTGPHHQVPLTQAQLQQQQQQQQHANELAKRRSRKPTDKSLPEGIEQTVVDEAVAVNYKKLRDFERRIDATMTRKRLDIVDSVARNAKRYKTLRIWITNTVEEQAWQNGASDTFEYPASQEACYRVKIEGRLLDDDEDFDKDDEEPKATTDTENGDKMDTDSPTRTKPKSGPAKPGQRYRFSHFFKALTVDFDRARGQLGAESSIEWKKPDRTPAGSNLPAAADFDELTFKRNGDSNANITINLYRHEDPERFELTPDLADIVDMKEASRQDVMTSLWDYIKLMNLLEDEEKRNFRCDDLLKKIVGQDAGSIPLLSEYISAHMRPLPPVKLAYTIRVDEEFHKDPQPTVYDVRVSVDDPLRAKLLPFIQNPQYATMLKEVALLDDQLATLVQAISASKAKHTFLASLAENPVLFVRTWLSSQNRDLEVIMGEAPRGGGEDAAGDEWRKGGKESIWSTSNARESVNVLLSKPPHR